MAFFQYCRFAIFLALHASALRSFPAICTWDPPIPVAAGSALSARVENPSGSRCQAVLRLADPAYLPITWSFQPTNCVGMEVIQFIVPLEAPNGDAYVTWECAGQGSAPVCNHVMITNGMGELNSTSLQLAGTVGCVSDVRQTVTTLRTLTTSNTVVTETLSSVITVPTTSFQTVPAPAVNNGRDSSWHTLSTTTPEPLAVPPLGDVASSANTTSSLAAGSTSSLDKAAAETTNPASVATISTIAAAAALTVTVTSVLSTCLEPTSA